ncbi:unnamed protein product [Anisakis simplex]|uniref:KOW domain-containing protein n=1 Tax=Anisakis simplex TaxID=6269 RepID=A0A0M3JKE5_ANISI|nr:unnamed protein product [Anisakis simplex]
MISVPKRHQSLKFQYAAAIESAASQVDVGAEAGPLGRVLYVSGSEACGRFATRHVRVVVSDAAVEVSSFDRL